MYNIEFLPILLLCNMGARGLISRLEELYKSMTNKGKCRGDRDAAGGVDGVVERTLHSAHPDENLVAPRQL